MNIAALLSSHEGAVPVRFKPVYRVERRRRPVSKLNKVAFLLNPVEHSTVSNCIKSRSAAINLNDTSPLPSLNQYADIIPQQTEPRFGGDRLRSSNANSIASLLNPSQDTSVASQPVRVRTPRCNSNRIAALLNPCQDGDAASCSAANKTAPPKPNHATALLNTNVAEVVLDQVETGPGLQREVGQVGSDNERAPAEFELVQNKAQKPRSEIERPQSEDDRSQNATKKPQTTLEQPYNGTEKAQSAIDLPSAMDSKIVVDDELLLADSQVATEPQIPVDPQLEIGTQLEASRPGLAAEKPRPEEGESAPSSPDGSGSPILSPASSPASSPFPVLSPSPTPSTAPKKPGLTTEDVIVMAACKRMRERNRWPTEIQRVWREHGCKSEIYAKHKLAWVALQIMRHKANNRRGFAGQSELRRICGYLPTLTCEEQKNIVARLNRELMKHVDVVARVNRVFKRRRGYSADEDITGEDLLTGVTSRRFAKISPKPVA